MARSSWFSKKDQRRKSEANSGQQSKAKMRNKRHAKDYKAKENKTRQTHQIKNRNETGRGQ